MQRPSFRLATLLSTLAIAAALAGCATTTYVFDPLKAPLAAGQRTVAISITANTGQVMGFDELQVRRLPSPVKPGEPEPAAEYFILRQVAPGMARDTTLFIGALPAGEYGLVQFRSNTSHKSLWLNRSGPSLPGTFKVDDKPVDLGRLIVTPLNERALYGRSAKVQSNQKLIERFSAEHAVLFKDGTVEGWTAPRAANDRIEEYAMLRPVGSDCVTEMPDGTVAAASRLNSVMMRSTNGRWRAVRGPGIDSLLCVWPVQLPNADLLAVGEFGTLLRHEPGSATLVPVDTGNLPFGNLLRIAGDEAAGWHVALQRDRQVTLYHSPTLEAGNWTPVRSEDVGFSVWNGVNQFWMWPTAQGFAYAVSKGPLNFFDFKTRAWSERPVPNERRIIDIRTSPTGMIGLLTSPGGGFGGITAANHISYDQAQSWENIDVPFTVKISPVQQTMDGTMLVWGGAFGQPELQQSKDKGRTWTRLGDYFRGRLLWPLKSGGLLDADLGAFGISWIQYSGDGGQNWKTEYSNYDRQAAERQK